MLNIYHNPRCQKSRQTLAHLEERDFQPNVILYLQTPLNAKQIKQLLQKLNIPIRRLLRTSEKAYKEMGLNNLELSEQNLIEAMVKQPKLIQRPIVETTTKAAIGRPPELVLDIL